MPAVLGGAEAQAATSELDALCPAMPLDVFNIYEVKDVQDIKPRTAEDQQLGLPHELHLALLAAIMLAQVGGKGLSQQG